ncbi:MAG TPA: ATP synthase F0 subunit A [Elusimicrobia bacterium]|nr:ATP synthase F0 subunit A [Elusimicrobiota bacterium]HBT61172.1 ATP synthase F0 subunit A [Elusimicrobiota bacterium]
MNLETLLSHHLLDHPYVTLFSRGNFTLAITKHLIMMWAVAALLAAVLVASVHSRSSMGMLLRFSVEEIILYIRDRMVSPIFGHAADVYLPYFLTLFFFILACNLAGLLPGSAAVTGNISVTAALALCTFALINFAGVREYGLVSHFAHFVPRGLPRVMAPLIFLIEIIGLCAKCLALCIRLFANIIAGHIVSISFLSLIFIFAQMSPMIGLGVAPAAVGLALFVYALDILVALIQAYIFTLLTAIFVGGAVHPH